MQSPRSSYRHVSYKKGEIPIYCAMEEELRKEYGLDYSALVKTSIKHLYQSKLQSAIQYI